MRVREAIKGCAQCARLFERMAAEKADPWIQDAFKKQGAVYLRLIEQDHQQGLSAPPATFRFGAARKHARPLCFQRSRFVRNVSPSFRGRNDGV